MNSETSRPSLYEIFLFPVGGALLIEGIHTKSNELQLFLAPIFIVIVRVFIAQFQVPRTATKSHNAQALRSCRAAVAWNQISTVPLLLFECAVVIVGSISKDPNQKDAMMAAWGITISLYCVYVLLRLLSRHYYIAATNFAAQAQSPA